MVIGDFQDEDDAVQLLAAVEGDGNMQMMFVERMKPWAFAYDKPAKMLHVGEELGLYLRQCYAEENN